MTSATAAARMPTLIQGAYVLTMDDALADGRYDVRLRDGRIHAVEPVLEPLGGEVVLDARGKVVLPGFVQTHIHLCQTLFRNLADDRALLDWLKERIWPFEGGHTFDSLRASADLGIAELLLGGTTAIVDMGTVHHTEAVFEALIDSGLRAIAGKCMMDAPDTPPALAESTAASIAESLALAERFDGAGDGRVRYGFAPRFVLSCTDELMRDVARLADERGLWIHTHSSENTDEVALVHARSGGIGNVAFLAELGISGPRTVLAHCIHLDADEVATLASSGTRVSHCVTSNLKLGSGICDVPGLVDAGVHVSLGADGAPCNNRLDMWTEMRTAALVQKPIHGPTSMPAELVLRLATRAGAEAIGMGDELGRIVPGFRADLQVVGFDDVLDGPMGPPASRLVYACSREAVEHVWVDGHHLVADKQLVRADKAEIGQRARGELTALLKRLGAPAA